MSVSAFSPPASVLGGLLVVVSLFCAPLFIGLGGWDLRSDEAIYAYAVDRMLETGEWLTPRSIVVDGPFLEKPPLKFWMTAALIGSGLVSQDEFGMRFPDAVMGAFAFVYIYLLGLRLSGAVCGVAAVLVTFSMEAVVFEHGLRSSNMEAPLVLAYCGGVYHFLRWAGLAAAVRVHALATAAYFVLGFMTKFVAVLFLPAIFVVAAIAAPDLRRQLTSRWREWVAPGAVAFVVIAPWFAYMTLRHGREFWTVILGQHVITRFTGALDPAHLAPWHYYFSRTWDELLPAGSNVPWLVALGAAGALLHWRDWRLRLVVLWWIVPIVGISLGTSKLFHYAYPFLPPLALLAGWAAGDMIHAAGGPWGRAVADRIGRIRLPASMSAVRPVLLAGAVTAVALALLTAISGRVAWRFGGTAVLQNSGIARPLMTATVLLLIAGRPALSVQTLVVLVVALLLPVSTYARAARRVTTVDHRFTAVRNCAASIREQNRHVATGVFSAAPPAINHSHYYYLHRLGAWGEPQAATPDELRVRLFDPEHQTLVLMTPEEYNRWRRFAADTSTPLPPAAVLDDVLVVTPGAYARCTSAAVAAGAPRPSAR